MSDQQVKYTITADATQANSELTRVDKAVVSLVGNESRLAAETAKATTALKQQGTVADHAAGRTRNFGQAAMEASRAVEDLQYGIGGVVNNIPSLVMALGGGMGMTAVISLAAVGVNQLVKNFTAVDPAAKAATDAAAEHVKGLRDKISGLAQDLRALQVGAERAAMETQASLVQTAANAASAAIDKAGGRARVERLSGRNDLPLTIKENVAAAKAAMDTLDNELSVLAGMERIRREKMAQKAVGDTEDLVKRQAKAIGDVLSAGGPRFLSSDAGGAARGRDAAIDADIANQRWEDALKAEDAARKEQARMDAEATREAERQADERVKIAQEEAKQKQAAAQEHGAFIAGQMVTTAGIISQAAVSAAAGQAAFGEVLLAGLSQQAGGFITLKGAEVAAAGAASAILGNPAGIAQAAAGAGMIALGASGGRRRSVGGGVALWWRWPRCPRRQRSP